MFVIQSSLYCTKKYRHFHIIFAAINEKATPTGMAFNTSEIRNPKWRMHFLYFFFIFATFQAFFQVTLELPGV
jgi:hypothetical protein